MPGNVEGQRDSYADHSGDSFQTVVYVVACVAVGATLIESGIADNRRIVINLCLGVYFAESEDEEFGVVDAVRFSSECLDFGVDRFCGCVCRAIVVEV